MRAKVIINPDANLAATKFHRPAADRPLERVVERAVERAVKRVLEAAGVQFDLVVARRAGRAEQEAIAASFAPYDAIVAAGDDGTVREVINGLIAGAGSGPTRRFGLLPVGARNDFSDMYGLPRDLAAAAQVIAAGHVHPVDAGRVSFIDDNGPIHSQGRRQGGFFHRDCTAAAEIVPVIEARKRAFLTGTIRHEVTLAPGEAKTRSREMQIAWDAGYYEGPVTLLAVAVGPGARGHLASSPNAGIGDSFFDFAFVPQLSRSETVKVLARESEGTHCRPPKVYSGRTNQIHVESRPGTPLWADGEIIAEAATVINYGILPGKISLLAP